MAKIWSPMTSKLPVKMGSKKDCVGKKMGGKK
jgi:hypothetical protein